MIHDYCHCDHFMDYWNENFWCWLPISQGTANVTNTDSFPQRHGIYLKFNHLKCVIMLQNAMKCR